MLFVHTLVLLSFTPKMETKSIKVSEIIVPKNGTRHEFNQASIKLLADNIQELGLINLPVVVAKGKKYEVIAGRNRIAAIKLLKWEEVNCSIAATQDKNILLDIEISENLQRDQLCLADEVEIVRKLMVGSDVPNVALRLNKPNGWVLDRVKLLELPEDALNANRLGFISNATLPLLCGLDSEKVLEMSAKMLKDKTILSKGWVENAAKFPELSDAKWDLNDTNIGKEFSAPACIGCPFSTTASELFSDDVQGGHCTKPTCFSMKKDAAKELMMRNWYHVHGITVIVSTSYNVDDAKARVVAMNEKYDTKYVYVSDKNYDWSTAWAKTIDRDTETERQETVEEMVDRIRKLGALIGIDSDGQLKYKPLSKESKPSTAKVQDGDPAIVGQHIAEIEKKHDNFKKWEDGMSNRKEKWFNDQWKEWLFNYNPVHGVVLKDMKIEILCSGADTTIWNYFIKQFLQSSRNYNDEGDTLELGTCIARYITSNTSIGYDERYALYEQYNPGAIAEYDAGVNLAASKRLENLNKAVDVIQNKIDAARLAAMSEPATPKKSTKKVTFKAEPKKKKK